MVMPEMTIKHINIEPNKRILVTSCYRAKLMDTELIRDDTHCKDYTDYVLPVNPGDILSLEKETSGGYIVKKNGISGWYFGELEKV